MSDDLHSHRQTLAIRSLKQVSRQRMERASITAQRVLEQWLQSASKGRFIEGQSVREVIRVIETKISAQFTAINWQAKLQEGFERLCPIRYGMNNLFGGRPERHPLSIDALKSSCTKGFYDLLRRSPQVDESTSEAEVNDFCLSLAQYSFQHCEEAAYIANTLHNLESESLHPSVWRFLADAEFLAASASVFAACKTIIREMEIPSHKWAGFLNAALTKLSLFQKKELIELTFDYCRWDSFDPYEYASVLSLHSQDTGVVLKLVEFLSSGIMFAAPSMQVQMIAWKDENELGGALSYAERYHANYEERTAAWRLDITKFQSDLSHLRISDSKFAEPTGDFRHVVLYLMRTGRCNNMAMFLAPFALCRDHRDLDLVKGFESLAEQKISPRTGLEWLPWAIANCVHNSPLFFGPIGAKLLSQLASSKSPERSLRSRVLASTYFSLVDSSEQHISSLQVNTTLLTEVISRLAIHARDVDEGVEDELEVEELSQCASRLLWNSFFLSPIDFRIDFLEKMIAEFGLVESADCRAHSVVAAMGLAAHTSVPKQASKLPDEFIKTIETFAVQAFDRMVIESLDQGNRRLCKRLVYFFEDSIHHFCLSEYGPVTREKILPILVSPDAAQYEFRGLIEELILEILSDSDCQGQATPGFGLALHLSHLLSSEQEMGGDHEAIRIERLNQVLTQTLIEDGRSEKVLQETIVSILLPDDVLTYPFLRATAKHKVGTPTALLEKNLGVGCSEWFVNLKRCKWIEEAIEIGLFDTLTLTEVQKLLIDYFLHLINQCQDLLDRDHYRYLNEKNIENPYKIINTRAITELVSKAGLRLFVSYKLPYAFRASCSHKHPEYAWLYDRELAR